jgi:hypothetical protein
MVDVIAAPGPARHSGAGDGRSVAGCGSVPGHRQAGLPPIKLHQGRHGAVSLQSGANVSPELTRRTVGHAKSEMTRRYTHPEVQANRAAAEATAAQVDGGL